MKRLQACRNCKSFTIEKICPLCKSTNLSLSWKGMAIILNPDSELARALKISNPGKYALFVS